MTSSRRIACLIRLRLILVNNKDETNEETDDIGGRACRSGWVRRFRRRCRREGQRDSLAPAEASALKIENGEVRLTVEVDASTDLKTWKPATTVDVTVPVEGEKGFYILKSK